MALRTRTLRSIPGTSDKNRPDVGGDDDSSAGDDVVVVGDVDDEVQAVASPLGSQLQTPAKKPKRKPKRNLGNITDLIDEFVVPEDVPTASTSELLKVLHSLYDNQTHLMDTYADLEQTLYSLPDLHCHMLLITIDDPQLLDYNVFDGLLHTNHVGCVRSPSLLKGRDTILKKLDGVCVFCLTSCTSTMIISFLNLSFVAGFSYFP